MVESCAAVGAKALLELVAIFSRQGWHVAGAEAGVWRLRIKHLVITCGAGERVRRACRLHWSGLSCALRGREANKQPSRLSERQGVGGRRRRQRHAARMLMQDAVSAFRLPTLLRGPHSCLSLHTIAPLHAQQRRFPARLLIIGRSTANTLRTPASHGALTVPPGQHCLAASTRNTPSHC